MKILYIGPNSSEWAQYNRPVSLAASKWARGFLTELSKCADVTAISHSHEHVWPKGDVFWRGYDARLYPSEWKCVHVSYPSIYRFREVWLRFAYPYVAKKVAKRDHYDLAIFYNCNEPQEVATMRVLHGMGIPCVPIILDGDDPRKDDWGWIKNAAQYASGIVSLSWWVHENCPVGLPKYHMDGGAEGWFGGDEYSPTNNKEIRLVHTGALDRWRGMNYMRDVVARLARPGIKFVFCGKTSARALEQEFGSHPNVELPGFVSEEKMREICNGADVLLSVRDPLQPDNILNYPSKLPHYLSFGRPVVSTRLESLSPDYADVVEFPLNDSVDSYVSKVEEVICWTEAQERDKFERIKNWFNNRKRWNVLVKGLVEWLESSQIARQ